ncbi:MAG TPA: DUF2298 domain-containing protein [Abditibacterium sp.]
MPFSEVALIFRWIVPLWVLGWLVLPLSSRLFPFLPDFGLAAGRVVALLLMGLLSFWGATAHWVSLDFSAYQLFILPIPGLIFWKNREFRSRISSNWRQLLLCDAIFLLAFAVFLWVRLRHPAAGDLEKPMDMALIAAALRADFLPFENPWFAGQNFTNYYYFGPFLGSLLARAFATPPQFAYNLVQPLFCAFFLSTTWSLAATLSKSAKIGVLAMLLVCVGGHFEPLRQIAQNGWSFPLDWWKTSRVIENTINEYPAFTLLIGDLHAHFYALCLAPTFLGLCFGILQCQSPRLRRALLVLGGAFLGVFALTNTWDTPLYALLWFGCALWNRINSSWNRTDDLFLGGALMTAPLVALPYFLRFKSQVSGVVFDPWVPHLFSFALLWGGWWALGFTALALQNKPKDDENLENETVFRQFLIAVGVLALVFPFVFYIHGAFGNSDLRYQDTVFKFGLQAWLLLGVGIACELGVAFRRWQTTQKALLRFASTVFALNLGLILSLAPASVLWTRANSYAPRNEAGKVVLSLDATRFLPPEDSMGIEWLRQNAKPGERVVEAIGNDFDANFARVSAFSGVASVLGWPQHASGWGASWEEVQMRTALVKEVYEASDSRAALRELRANYVFVGAREPKIAPASHLKIVWQSPSAQTQIFRVSSE